MPNLYVFGDSFTYGYNFYPNEEARIKSIWATKFASKLNYNLINYALPGASNWRSARILNSLDLKKEDLVVVAFSHHCRFEFGVNNECQLELPNLIGDIVEEDNLIKTKRFFEQLTDRTTDPHAKQFNNLAYTKFYNPYWFSEMQVIMHNSMIQKIKSEGAKWLFFNAWSSPYETIVNIEKDKNYLFGPTETLHNKLFPNTPIEYWSEEQHTIIADYLLGTYKNIYS
jgi:hypothetical protein